tara:strand:- start:272 stop:469 length:198 start_codon:yes stop_codon:yes gene_type:complete
MARAGLGALQLESLRPMIDSPLSGALADKFGAKVASSFASNYFWYFNLSASILLVLVWITSPALS